MLKKILISVMLVVGASAFASSDDLGLTDAAEVFLTENCQGFDGSQGGEVQFIDGDAEYAIYVVIFDNAWATVEATRREATEQDGWPFYEYDVTDFSCTAQ